MDNATAVRIFESLSSGVRLDVYRLLVAAGAEGLNAGDIADKLDMAPSSLSFHLKALTHAQLVSVERGGRFLRYRANIPVMLQMIGFLTENCCGGHPEHCVEVCVADCATDPTRAAS